MEPDKTLLPCPFPSCGKSPPAVWLNRGSDGICYIECECGAEGPYEDGEAAALAAWNAAPRDRRAPGGDAPAEGGCPCLYTTPCHPECTCVCRFSSRGCRRCASYGSAEQQRVAAEHLAARIDAPAAPPGAIDEGAVDAMRQLIREAKIVADYVSRCQMYGPTDQLRASAERAGKLARELETSLGLAAPAGPPADGGEEGGRES